MSLAYRVYLSRRTYFVFSLLCKFHRSTRILRSCFRRRLCDLLPSIFGVCLAIRRRNVKPCPRPTCCVLLCTAVYCCVRIHNLRWWEKRHLAWLKGWVRLNE